jgi:hypothetical protein
MDSQKNLSTNSLTEMINLELQTAQRYADYILQVNEPKLQEALKTMEMGARNNHKSLLQALEQLD